MWNNLVGDSSRLNETSSTFHAYYEKVKRSLLIVEIQSWSSPLRIKFAGALLVEFLNRSTFLGFHTLGFSSPKLIVECCQTVYFIFMASTLRKSFL